jgi:type I restriction enzyme, S subunit
MQNQITKNWQEYKIDDLKANKPNAIAMGPFGSNIKSDNFIQSGVPVIRGVNLINNKFRNEDFVFITESKADQLRSSNVYPGDLVFTHRGTLGQVGLIPEGKYKRYVASQSQMKLSVDVNIVDPLFLYYYFSSIGNRELLTHASGSGVPAIANPLTSLKNLRVLLPPLPSQKSIAEFLSILDDRIEVNNKIAKTLEEMAQILFKEWFVKVPYPVGKLSDIAKITMGQSPSSEFYNQRELGLPFHQGVTNFGSRFPKHQIYCTQNNRVADKGDILFSVRAPVGRLNIADTKISLGRGVASIRHKRGFQSYLYYLLKRLFKKEDSLGGGSVFPAVTKNDMEGMKILIPNDEVLQRFEDIVSGIDRKIELIEKENQKLAAFRDLLLPKLMKGEIEI